MWKRGPLPPNTWQWGGVVPKSNDSGPYSGFFFADFHGDYVTINPGTADAKRLESDEVAYYNNSLSLPIQLDGAEGVKGRV